MTFGHSVHACARQEVLDEMESCSAALKVSSRPLASFARRSGVLDPVTSAASAAWPSAFAWRSTIRFPGLEAPPDLDLKLRIVSEAGDRLIAYAWEQPSAEERARVIEETRRMLAAYLF